MGEICPGTGMSNLYIDSITKYITVTAIWAGSFQNDLLGCMYVYKAVAVIFGEGRMRLVENSFFTAIVRECTS